MNTDSYSKILRISLILSLLFFTVSYTSIASAAQGCGRGWHRAAFGKCVLNHRWHYARPARHHRGGCWRNAWGQLRCHR